MKAVLIIPAFLFFLSCSEPVEKITPQRGKLVESVYSSVTIQPDSLYSAYTNAIGILERNLVEEGDQVEVGTPIAQLINTAPVLNKENAKLNFLQAQDNYSGTSALLKSLEKEIQSARLALRNDSLNYLRQKRLWNQKIGSRLEFENRKLAYEISSNKFQVLKEEFDRTKNTLSIQMKQALNNYKASEFTSEEFTLTSKIKGVVYALFKEPGEIVNTVEPLALIGSADNFVIELLVDEMDIVKVKEGQKTFVTLEAYGSRVFEAEINKIFPTKDQSTQTFKLEAVFLTDAPKLFPGLVGEANIVVAEKENSLIIPKEYLLDEYRVLTEEGPVNIVTGIQDMVNIEIISGIDADETLYKPEQ